MITTLRTFTHQEDPYGVQTSLEKFLKEKNTAALVEVLMDPYEIGTHGSTTKMIMMSDYARCTPEVQQELLETLNGFDLASLETTEKVREMVSFTYLALSQDRMCKKIKLIVQVRDKRVDDFRAGKFSSLPLSAQGDILINSSHGTRPLSEEEIDALTELQAHEYGRYWSTLMFKTNPYKAIDFVAAQNDGKRLTRFAIINGINQPGTQIDSINYIFEKYGYLLSDENRNSLNEWRELTVEKIEKKE